MARLAMTGAETGHLNGDYILTQGSPTVDASLAHSGQYSYRVAASGSNVRVMWTGAESAFDYCRFWFRTTAYPDVNIQIGRFYNGGSAASLFVELMTDGKLRFSTVGGSTFSTSVAIGTDTWVCVEMAIQIIRSTSITTIGRVNGVVVSTQQVIAGLNVNPVDELRVGWISGSATNSPVFSFDDIAINDGSGGAQNAWPGIDGKIVHLHPISDSAVGTGWTNNNGGAFSPGAYDCLNNRPPSGVAFNAASTPQNQIRNASANATDVDVNLESYTTGGVGASDVVLVERWVVAYSDSNAVSTRAMAAQLLSNPAEAAETALTSGTTAAGAYPSGWPGQFGTSPSPFGPMIHLPTVVKGTSPVWRFGKRNTDTASSGACYAALQIEYGPPAAIVFSDSPVGTLVLSGTCTDNTQPLPYTAHVIRVTRELPPLRHHIVATTPNGRNYRWAGDEPSAENVFNGLRWGSTMPGGYESCDCVLPREPGVVYADIERLTTLQIIGAGGSVVGEYRLERIPQTSGDQMAISPSAVGWQAHLDDNKGVSIIYIDRDLGGWQAWPTTRLLQLYASSLAPQGTFEAGSDVVTGVPELRMALQAPWPAQIISEAWYDAGAGNKIGRVSGTMKIYPNTNITGDAQFVVLLEYGNPPGNGPYQSLDIRTLADGTNWTFASTAATQRMANFQFRYALAFSGDELQRQIATRNLRVFGNHGLTIRGSTPQTEGFWCSDIVAHAVRTWAPLLKLPSGSIQATTFIIPQSSFRDTTTVSEIVKQSTRFGLEDWAVWNDKSFYLNPRNGNPMARKWRSRVGPAKLEQTGQQVDRLWESVLVQYNDVDGSTKVVGPLGSGADTEDASLKDNDPTNPANALGITRRDKLIMGISTPAGAIQVGRRFLEEQKAIDRSGRATLVGFVEDEHGVLFPYSEVRAGDQITFTDAADTSYRRIVKANHDDAAKTASVDLDAPPEGLQAVLERLGVVLAPLGL